MNIETNYFDLSKSKQYQKIIDDLLPLATDGTGFPVSNLSFLIDALNRQKRYDEAITIGKKFLTEVEKNKYAVNALCFAVYMAKILPEKKANPITSATGKTTLWIIDHLPKNTASFVWTESFFLTVNWYFYRNDIENTKKLMRRVTAEELSTDVNTFEVNDKTVTPRSDRAKYLRICFDLAMAEHDYESALRFAEALLHLDSKDVWYKRNKALALIELKRHSESIALYKEISERKKDWFIWYEMAKLSLVMNHRKEAEVYFAKAVGASRVQSPLFVWHLFVDIAAFLQENGDHTTAKKHLDYIFLSAFDDKGNKPQALLKHLNQIRFKPSEGVDPQSLIKEIRSFHSEKEFPGEKLDGAISRINEGGKSGFISSGNKHYFFISKNFRGKNPKEGASVTFSLEKKTNPKTGVEEDQAVNVVLTRTRD